MRIRRTSSVIALASLAAVMTTSLGGTAVARPGAAATTYKCRSQVYSYTHGKKHVLNSSVGPRLRTNTGKAPALTDNRITASYDLVNNDPEEHPARFVNVVSEFPQGQKVTRFESVTIYPVKGHPRHYSIGRKHSKGSVYKYDLLMDRGQVQVPVNGNNGDGRATPKLKKVVVNARENCFATQ